MSVAHPGKLRVIYGSKRKNDQIDAQKLAKLLLLDMVPPVHVSSIDVRAWRSLVIQPQRSTLMHFPTASRTALPFSDLPPDCLTRLLPLRTEESSVFDDSSLPCSIFVDSPCNIAHIANSPGVVPWKHERSPESGQTAKRKRSIDESLQADTHRVFVAAVWMAEATVRSAIIARGPAQG